MNIFNVAESFFISSIKQHPNKIETKNIVKALMKDNYMLANVSQIRHCSPDKIKKEVALNLLTDLLTLYIRVHGFSYVKDKLQAYKIQKSKTKSRSLRTSIKKQSTSFEQGH